MSKPTTEAPKQTKPFVSPEQEVLLGLLTAAARLDEPWVKFLKANAELTRNQYNVLRILRGSHPVKLASKDIVSRMIDRDPDATRLIDRLEKRGLVKRFRSSTDRRVVEIGMTAKGLELTSRLDADVLRMPKALLGHLGPVRLRQLTKLLESVIADLGSFP
jgi:DNA-binding MarR family transcriptional regulator